MSDKNENLAESNSALARNTLMYKEYSPRNAKYRLWSETTPMFSDGARSE